MLMYISADIPGENSLDGLLFFITSAYNNPYETIILLHFFHILHPMPTRKFF